MQLRKLGMELGIMAAIVVALALLGPFGSYATPLAQRLAQWALFVFGGYALFRPVIWAGRIVAAQSGIPQWLCIACACVLAAMPTTLLVAWLISGDTLGEAPLTVLLQRYLEVLIVGAVATLVQLALARPEPPSTTAEPPGPPPGRSPAQPGQPDPVAAAPSLSGPAPSRPKLAERIPALGGGPILALSHEDHYVRVHHAAGSTLLLMRISDAVSELDGVDGLRVHRSWWVAREAVTGTETRGRALWLKLSNGLEAPIARSMVPELKAAGWV